MLCLFQPFANYDGESLANEHGSTLLEGLTKDGNANSEAPCYSGNDPAVRLPKDQLA